jgi:hypothetical protein
MSEICQSCGMPLEGDENRGSEKDGSKSEEYCVYCYKEGVFVDEGISLKEKIEKNVAIAVKMGMSEEDARAMAEKVLPGLKRWKNG